MVGAGITSDQGNALGFIQDVKTTQVSMLRRLSLDASRARNDNNEELADALTIKAIALSRHNLILHRAKKRILVTQDLSAVNQRLLSIVRQVDAEFNAISNADTLLISADKVIKLISHLIDAVSKHKETNS